MESRMLFKNVFRKIPIVFWRFIAARPSFQRINELMLDCSLRGLGILNYESDRLSGEKYFLEKLLPLYLPNDKFFVLDIGAHIGEYTKKIASANPNASIWAFEPNPKTFMKLKENIKETNVLMVNKGLGSKEAEVAFYDRKDRDGSSAHGSLYREVIEEIHHVESVELIVPLTTLDDCTQEVSRKKISLIKIDAEGHELEVLKGARELIEGNWVDLFHIEFNEMNIISRVFFKDIALILSSYQAYRILPNGVIQLKESPFRTELFGFQNIIFVNKKLNPNKKMKPKD